MLFEEGAGGAGLQNMRSLGFIEEFAVLFDGLMDFPVSREHIIGELTYILRERHRQIKLQPKQLILFKVFFRDNLGVFLHIRHRMHIHNIPPGTHPRLLPHNLLNNLPQLPTNDLRHPLTVFSVYLQFTVV